MSSETSICAPRTPLTVIEVTKVHIALSPRGVRSKTRNPISIAVSDVFPGAHTVQIGSYYDRQSGNWSSLTIMSHKATLRWTLPPEIRSKLEHYYQTGEMEPFVFSIFL